MDLRRSSEEHLPTTQYASDTATYMIATAIHVDGVKGLKNIHPLPESTGRCCGKNNWDRVGFLAQSFVIVKEIDILYLESKKSEII